MVSGRYRSGDIAFVWTQVMPLAEGGTSSKSGPEFPLAAEAARRLLRGHAKAPSPAAPARRSMARRDIAFRGAFTSMAQHRNALSRSVVQLGLTGRTRGHRLARRA